MQLEGARLIRSFGTASKPRYELRTLPGVKEREMVWLPNTLIDGVSGIVGPVEQLRQTQDAMTLRLFVGLYAEQNLREDGGISRHTVWVPFVREHLSDRGAYTVWGWRQESGPWVSWSSPATRPHWVETTEEQKAKGLSPAREFFPRLDAIVNSGLAEWVPHIMESDSPEAETVLALRRPRQPGGREDVEAQLWAAAYDASHRLLQGNEGAETRAEENGLDYRVPLPIHMKRVHMVGVLRLRHRPHTPQTSAWWADYDPRAQKWLHMFEALARGDSPRASADPSLKANGKPSETPSNSTNIRKIAG
jgi:hypothetical protein